MHPVYQILVNRAVKRGPFATVWHARDSVLDREIALKELRNWPARPARARLCFQFAHVRRLTLDHPGLAPVHGEDPDRGWLALDHFPAGSLADRLASDIEPTPPAAVQTSLIQVLQTLAFLHERQFVHGAVKPANLFLAAEARWLLADGLGLRVEASGRTSESRELYTCLEPQEARYLAPECLEERGEPLGPPADLYALGMTFLEILLGRAWFASLFPRIQVAAQSWTSWQLSEETLPSLGELLPDAPHPLVEVIDGLLRKSPHQRLTAPAALAILAPQPPPAPVPLPLSSPDPQPSLPPPARMESWRRGFSRQALVPGVLGVVVLGILLGSFFRPRPVLPQIDESVVEELASTRAALTRSRGDLAGQLARADRLEREWTQTRTELVRARNRVAEFGRLVADYSRKAVEFRTRAEALEKELKTRGDRGDRQQVEALRQRADELENQLQLARAGKEEAARAVELQRGQAERLEKQLQTARAELAAAQREAGELRVHAKRLEKQLTTAQEEGKENDDVSRMLEERLGRVAVAALKRLDGKVEVDPSRPGQAVKVDLSVAKVTDEDLGLLAGLPALKSLSVSSPNVSDAGLVHLEGLGELRALDLSFTRMTDAGLAHLRRFTHLRTLSLYSTRVTDSGLAHLEGLAEMRTLDLSFTRVGDAGLARLRGAVHLETLSLSSTQVSDAGLPSLKGLSRLHTLDLSFTKLSDVGLAHLKDLRQLQALLLSRTRISNAGLAHLAGLVRLHALDLAFTRVSDAGLEALGRLTNLETLSLSSTQISDAGLKHLAGLSRLRTLDLSVTRIGDDALSRLEGLAHLETLSLSSTRISDAGLTHLGKCAGLRELYLANTRATPAGIAELRKTLPHCVVHP